MKKLNDAAFNVVVWMFTSIAFVLGWLAQPLPFWAVLLIALFPFLGSMWLFWSTASEFRKRVAQNRTYEAFVRGGAMTPNEARECRGDE